MGKIGVMPYLNWSALPVILTHVNGDDGRILVVDTQDVCLSQRTTEFAVVQTLGARSVTPPKDVVFCPSETSDHSGTPLIILRPVVRSSLPPKHRKRYPPVKRSWEGLRDSIRVEPNDGDSQSMNNQASYDLPSLREDGGGRFVVRTSSR
ncbi:unnamed protein product [Cyclocybe aegerita]|uniref:Uncharacterized protein n=1 Tax=Cyclocybe aegerita TaxID=1973307 RepID=A0A8S0VTN2_CYCAE|nr:unnamed protein product [Cyclocybe aegerita]